MTVEDIKQVVREFRVAALIKMRIDGVELHASNGYLLDSFLRNSSNKRTD